LSVIELAISFASVPAWQGS